MKKKTGRTWRRPLAGLLTLAMIVSLLAAAPLSASATELQTESQTEQKVDENNVTETSMDKTETEQNVAEGVDGEKTPDGGTPDEEEVNSETNDASMDLEEDGKEINSENDAEVEGSENSESDVLNDGKELPDAEETEGTGSLNAGGSASDAEVPDSNSEEVTVNDAETENKAEETPEENTIVSFDIPAPVETSVPAKPEDEVSVDKNSYTVGRK